MLRRKPSRRASDQRGLTIVELVSVSAVLLIMVGMTIPVAATIVQRQKELELRGALREMREALDQFQLDAQKYPGIAQKNLNRVNEELYPEKIEQLVEGIDIGDAAGTKLKYLRRIPVDPFTGEAEWGTRSSRDRPDALFSDGINIFDVYSLSDKVSLDGTKYATW